MPSGFEISRELDSAGRTRRSVRPGVLPVALSYDSQGRLETVVQGSRTQTFGYNARNELTSVEDPTGRIVRFEYDGAGRVTKQIVPDLREIAFTYDPNGNLLSVTPPGRSAHSFVYSGVNLPTRYTPPAVAGTGVTEYIYNVDKQLEQIVRPDAAIALGYDDGGRLESVSSRGLLLEYAYDEGGNLETIDGLDASLTYSYDGSSPLSMTWSGAVSGAVTWTYDADGRLFSESVGGELVEFYYDADGRLDGAGELFMGYTNGLVDYVGGISGVAEGFAHNSFGEVESSEQVRFKPDFSEALVTERVYTRDGAGRIIGITETLGASSTALGYHYDDAGRLDEVTYPEGIVRYTYDDNGNRTARQVVTDEGTEVETASYDDQDRLLNYEGTQYTYTAGGNLLTKTDGTGTTEYDYDPLGNLRKVTLGDGTVIEYLIDAQSRRVGRKVNGTVTHTWLYADQLRIISETDHTRGGPTKRFVYALRSNVPDYMIANGTYYRMFTDHLGSVREVVDTSTLTAVQSLHYDEFGYVLTDTNPGLVPFAFAGGLYDPATRLTRFGARDYDARTGRWTAKEPLGFAGGSTNLYSYVDGDPINFVDPTGRSKARDVTQMTCRQLVQRILKHNFDISKLLNNERQKQLGGKGREGYAGHKELFDKQQAGLKRAYDEWRKRCFDDDDPSNNALGDKAVHWLGQSYPPPLPEITEADKHAMTDGLLIVGGVAMIVGTIIEDVGTVGVGIADDPLTIGLGLTMIGKGMGWIP